MKKSNKKGEDESNSDKIDTSDDDDDDDDDDDEEAELDVDNEDYLKTKALNMNMCKRTIGSALLMLYILGGIYCNSILTVLT